MWKPNWRKKSLGSGYTYLSSTIGTLATWLRSCHPQFLFLVFTDWHFLNLEAVISHRVFIVLPTSYFAKWDHLTNPCTPILFHKMKDVLIPRKAWRLNLQDEGSPLRWINLDWWNTILSSLFSVITGRSQSCSLLLGNKVCRSLCPPLLSRGGSEEAQREWVGCTPAER